MIVYEDPSKSQARENKARAALEQALKPSLQAANKIGQPDGVKVKIVKSEAPPVVVQETGFSEKPTHPEFGQDPVRDAVYEFFGFNPWTGEGETKKKIGEILQFMTTSAKVDSRGKAVQTLSRMAYKMGAKDMFEPKIDQFHRYIRLRAAAQDLDREMSAYQKK